MRSSMSLAAILAVAVVSSQCGGGDKSADTPTTPGNTTPQTVTVSIVGIKGNQSYAPNPVQKSGGEQLIFKNNDTAVHHIVMDDNSADFGNLSPGATSAAKAVTSGNFHCMNHPSMVGSVNGPAAPDPPVGSGDGY
jgi:plastocyanin